MKTWHSPNISSAKAIFNQITINRDALCPWSKLKHGQVATQIAQLQSSLYHLCMCSSISIEEEKHILTELEHLKDFEQAFWRQHSQVEWLKVGDQNTKFFS